MKIHQVLYNIIRTLQQLYLAEKKSVEITYAKYWFHISDICKDNLDISTSILEMNFGIENELYVYFHTGNTFWHYQNYGYG